MTGAPPPPERIGDGDALRSAVEERARALGFDGFGTATATALEVEEERLRAWLDEGRHGTMEWLARDPSRRCDPQRVLPNCRTVVVLSLAYHTQAEEHDRRDPQPAGKVSRYARGRDYHRVIEKKLRRLARFIDNSAPRGTVSRPYVDYGPVMERAWAERAGLGFIGKHTLLIDPARGSWFFLGTILTTAAMPQTTHPDIMTGCGDCRRCIEACPTDAIDEPWSIDARRCTSYLTIEHDGEIPPDLADRMEDWVFGCDICQEVCPYNVKRAAPREDDPLAPCRAPAEWSLRDLLETTKERFDEEFVGTPLRRPGAERLHRNAQALLDARKRRGET